MPLAFYAQNTRGITGVPDTSFTTYTAFLKEKKYHPEIQLPVVPASKNVIEKTGITYFRIGKRKLLCDAFFPVSGKGNGIAIVIIHGGGWRSGNRAQHHGLAQALAAKGYTCFTPEYRLSTEALFPAAVYDIKAMLRWVHKNAEKYAIDKKKIVIAGFSAGGELAAFAGNTNNHPAFEGKMGNTRYSSAVAAIIDIDGTLSFVHPESGEGDDSKGPSAATLWMGYSKKENPELWKAASPLTYAGKNSVPTLFINSSVARMHAGRDDYLKILNEYKIYNEVHTFADSPHTFCLFEPWFGQTVTFIDNFLKKCFQK